MGDPEKRNPERSIRFCRYRRDPRTGKIYDAHDYGYVAWPIPIRR